MTKKTLTAADLAQFSGGTDNWYRHHLVRSALYTDGVKYVAETAGAYWLIDLIATSQMLRSVAAEPFQSWKLTVKDKQADLVCTDGGKDGKYTTLHSEHIDYTDFPLDEIEMWVERDGPNRVLLLPSEH